MKEILDDYNQISGSHMDPVLFEDAVSRICRISSVMNQSAGSALLVGVGDSGRQSLTRLAASIAEYELVDWKTRSSVVLRGRRIPSSRLWCCCRCGVWTDQE